MYRQPSAQVFAISYNWIHVYSSTSRVRRVRLDVDSILDTRISESMRTGDEHIGPDGRPRVSRFLRDNRLGRKKALMSCGSGCCFARSHMTCMTGEGQRWCQQTSAVMRVRRQEIITL